jgi:protein involved in polysaccharide export with SLBB domain
MRYANRILFAVLVLSIATGTGTPIFLLAQHVPAIGSIKLGKLTPGDKLRLTLFRKPDIVRDLGETCKLNLTLTLTVMDDGTIRVPILDKVPAGGSGISELTTALQTRYNSYFATPPEPCTTTPPHVSIQYIDHEEKMTMDALIERVAPTRLH